MRAYLQGKDEEEVKLSSLPKSISCSKTFMHASCTLNTAANTLVTVLQNNITIISFTDVTPHRTRMMRRSSRAPYLNPSAVARPSCMLTAHSTTDTLVTTRLITLHRVYL
jgi:hypothetical protein